jgi:glycosyltransferase involved in cell wall biosynthesis
MMITTNWIPDTLPADHVQAKPQLLRPRAEGKFLWVGTEKFFVRGVTYGAFPPDRDGHQFPDSRQVALDFALMRRAGINSILTYTVPPRHFLDCAQEYGLRVIINVPWMGHVCFLEQASTRRDARDAVKKAAATCRSHPAVLMYAVAKELPPQIVRWHGKKRVETFLRDLVYVAKDEDPDSLVTYTNFPTTEYLELPFVDVQTFNVYLHQREQFCSYLARLQHLAGELPLVLSEFGICSFRHGRERQADFLDWQLDEADSHGLAGTVVFSWTDPFYQDGCLVDEWGFGLVDSDRRPKPSYGLISHRFNEPVPSVQEQAWPKVSVVVALYNAQKTLDECLSSLAKLDYPDYEVIVVNDGSTDGSQAIIDRYPFRSITCANGGISAARNMGLAAAMGEIVAYIDSDAFADPDWLRCLVRTFQKTKAAGVGGPNIVPVSDSWVAKCVFRSPGGPTQVMLDDHAAEHIPGCNMAFWKWALDEIGGFDAIYTAAGDDVDVCWRLLERGHGLGFSPSALVWHHRRPSVRAFWRQQVGYGVAESLLERKHPHKFNSWGHASWGGTIYSPYPQFSLTRKSAIYQGLWGSAPFQSLYDAGGGGPWDFLPRAMEMHLTLGALVAVSTVFHWALVPVGLGIAYIAFYCTACALSADLSVLARRPDRAPLLERLKWRSMIAWLHFLEPLARDWGRLKGGLTPWRSALPHEPNTRMWSRWWQRLQPFRRTVKWQYRGDMRLEKHAILQRLTSLLAGRGCSVAWNPDFQPWDMKLRRGALGEASLRMVVEHHGGLRRVARFSAGIQPNVAVSWAVGILAAAAGVMVALGLPLPAAALVTLLGVLWLTTIREANRLEVGLRAATDRVCPEPASGEPGID